MARAEAEMQHKVNQVIYRQQPQQDAVVPAVDSTSKRVLKRVSKTGEV